MSVLKRSITVLSVVLSGVIALLFVLENPQLVTITWFGWSLPAAPVAVLMLLTLILGLLIGLLIAMQRLPLRKRKV